MPRLLELLSFLNAKRPGENLSQVKQQFYDKAASLYSNIYQNNGFDAWIGFLQQMQLLNVTNSNAAITQNGIEYLAWRVERAKPPKTYG